MIKMLDVKNHMNVIWFNTNVMNFWDISRTNCDKDLKRDADLVVEWLQELRDVLVDKESITKNSMMSCSEIDAIDMKTMLAKLFQINETSIKFVDSDKNIK